MAVASWTPNSIVHINDGTAELDLNYINNDVFGSQYRGYPGSGKVTDLLIRHQTQQSVSGFVTNERHNMTYIYVVPGTTASDPSSRYQASFTFQCPKLGDATVASQMLNALPALLSVSAVRSQLITWRV